MDELGVLAVKAAMLRAALEKRAADEQPVPYGALSTAGAIGMGGSGAVGLGALGVNRAAAVTHSALGDLSNRVFTAVDNVGADLSHRQMRDVTSNEQALRSNRLAKPQLSAGQNMSAMFEPVFDASNSKLHRFKRIGGLAKGTGLASLLPLLASAGAFFSGRKQDAAAQQQRQLAAKKAADEPNAVSRLGDLGLNAGGASMLAGGAGHYAAGAYESGKGWLANTARQTQNLGAAGSQYLANKIPFMANAPKIPPHWPTALAGGAKRFAPALLGGGLLAAALGTAAKGAGGIYDMFTRKPAEQMQGAVAAAETQAPQLTARQQIQSTAGNAIGGLFSRLANRFRTNPEA